MHSKRRSPASRAFSGEVETGSPQKMRPLKDNQSEFRFQRNGIRSSKISAKPKPASTRLDQRACVEMIVHH